ncbi:MAG: hypothetical protein ACM3JI_00935 [Anaerolineae bacterium]
MKAILFCGIIWFFIGAFLLIKGLHFIVDAISDADLLQKTSLIKPLLSLMQDKEQAALFLIACGLIVGFIKGRIILIKTIRRLVERILTKTVPFKITEIYTTRYYVLIGLMMGLGFGMRFMPFGQDVRGCIDVAIGSALVNGALLFFRFALAVRQMRYL